MVAVETSTSIQEFLGSIEADGVSSLGLDKAEALEGYIIECNEAMSVEGGSPLVADAIYDRLVEVLKEIKPGSAVLNDLWEPDGDISDYGSLLASHPMKSIRTVKTWDAPELFEFKGMAPKETFYLFVTYKVNGHGIRVVYNDGELVLATSRARASAGRDLTRQMKNILGESNEALKGMGLVEIRGEIALPIASMGKAREFNPALKSPFSAVSSLIKPSSSVEENLLLTFLAFAVLFEGGEAGFSSKAEEYGFLEDSGFSVPGNWSAEVTEGEDVIDVMRSVLESLEEEYDSFGYFCDGLVAEIDDRDTFEALGSDEKFNYGNLALKLGIWAQDMYAGVIQGIIWTPGKSKMAPVAIVSENEGDAEFDWEGKLINSEKIGVLTAQGNRVRRVPLYEPRNLLKLQAYPGKVLNFRYGGEAGVVPCTEEGHSLTDDAVRNMLIG